MNRSIDLRSDTVTRPTPAMRAAMAAAEVGDDVYGDDPTVNALQERMAAHAGLRGGAVRAHRHAEQPVRADGPLRARRRIHRRPDGAHLPLRGRRRRGAGRHPAAAAGAAARRHAAAGRHRSRDQARRRALRAQPAAGAGEHLRRQVLPLAYMRSRHGAGAPPRPGHASRRRAPVQRRGGHCAGAGRRCARHARAIAGHFDSVSVCFSKGLGAPVGSVLCGSKAFIDRAHRIRKMAGGGMRQAGMLAAAALHALDHHIDRLAEDHANARAWPRACRACRA